MEKIDVMNRIISRMPGPKVEFLEIDEKSTVRFEWYGHSFRVQLDPFMIEEMTGDGMLSIGPLSSLVKHIIRGCDI